MPLKAHYRKEKAMLIRVSHRDVIADTIEKVKKPRRRPKKKNKDKQTENLDADPNDALVALTAYQLLALHKSLSDSPFVDSFEFVRPKYQEPCPTRVPSLAGDDVADLKSLVCISSPHTQSELSVQIGPQLPFK